MLLRETHGRGNVLVLAGLFTLVLIGGCTSKEPEKKINYSPNKDVSQNQPPPTSNGADAPVAPGGNINPMNDQELARKGQEIRDRTGGDVNKMTEQEKKIFFEAARNGHL
jgi:hypothetical protein